MHGFTDERLFEFIQTKRILLTRPLNTTVAQREKTQNTLKDNSTVKM